ncbi:hypothetical protein KFK09_006423 [Dendrobium nobile]|uniref:C2H2-type domain-containing protein n=1 Tax=Dendrobium nobile TaxID=94219 RepID=A0A8T3BUG1_DENNO|nr:hypothetical protein KFK09_006423 [Dendrobium nobile]
MLIKLNVFFLTLLVLINQNGILCLACLTEFNTSRRLKNSHDLKKYYTCHRKNYNYYCGKCGNFFLREADLAIHREDVDRKKFSCARAVLLWSGEEDEEEACEEDEEE